MVFLADEYIEHQLSLLALDPLICFQNEDQNLEDAYLQNEDRLVYLLSHICDPYICSQNDGQMEGVKIELDDFGHHRICP